MSIDAQDQKALVQQLPDDLQLAEGNYLSEEDFLAALAPKVAYMLQYNSGVFFQLLYKMDVLEPKLQMAMQTVDVPMSIARLILERQLEKLAARKAHPSKQGDDKDLAW